MSARRPGWVLLIWGMLVLSSPAGAQPAAPDATAKRLYAAALQAYDSGRYDVAIKAFEAAYARAPADLLLFDLAQSYRKKYVTQGDAAALTQAIALYRRFLATSATGRERAAAAEALTELLLAAPSTAPTAPSPPASREEPVAAPSKTEIMVVADADNATVALDNRPASPAPLLETVTAGEHHAHVAAPGYRPGDVRVTAVEGRFVVSEARLQPLPGTLALSGRRGSTLQIDGVDAGALPLGEQSLPAGRHRLSLRLRGFQPWEHDVDLERNRRLEVRARPVPTAQRRAVPWLGAAAALLGAATIPAGVVWGLADRDARAIWEQQQGGPITFAERDEYNRDRSRRDQALIATSVTLAVGGALALTSVALYLLDRR